MKLTVVSVVLASALWAALWILFIHPDFHPAMHAYGFTVGTDTHYCSAVAINWHLFLSCETAS